VQQISATQAQTARKAAALALSLGQAGPPGSAVRSHALLWLCRKLLEQAEAQLVRLPAFAFALAQVVALLCAGGESAEVPELLPLLEAHLFEACPLLAAVGVRYSKEAFPDERAFFLALGYLPTGGADGQLEPTDAFLGRLAALVRLYAAVLQSDLMPAESGAQRAWAFLARLLNGLPPNRESATALEAFLSVAGYRLACAYGRQFLKLLRHVHSAFLPRLEAAAAAGEAEARPLAVVLRAGLEGGEMTRPAAGRELAASDLSSNADYRAR
jgi:nucleoporin GLE1